MQVCDPREGLVIYDVTFAHGSGAPRPIVHRMSMPEMTVRCLPLMSSV